MAKYRDLLPVIIERENATLPEGCDTWGVKSVQPDLRTYGGYQWPLPGGVAECDPERIVRENTGACPVGKGDGLCVATTWEKMASGGIPARTLLLVAYHSTNVLGHNHPEPGAAPDKLRVSKAHVVAVVDGERLIREDGERADLRYADLQGADLRYADLRRADLRDAKFQGADLRDTDLQDADLRGADLEGADLRHANFKGANFKGANLQDADLRYADLQGADLRYADLRRADLRGADLRGAHLDQAHADERTRLPSGYTVRDGHIEKEN